MLEMVLYDGWQYVNHFVNHYKTDERSAHELVFIGKVAMTIVNSYDDSYQERTSNASLKELSLDL